MPKQASKRKADGPVATTAPSKLRKTVGSIARRGDVDEGVFGKGEKRKRGVVDFDEDGDDDDDEESETQQLLKIVKFGSREKREAAREAGEYLKGFKWKVEEGEREVEKKLDDMNVEAEKKDAEFLKSIKTAYTLATPFALQGTRKELVGFAALYERSKNTIAFAESLVEKFEDVVRRVKNLDTTGLTANKWKEEDKVVARLLAAGRKVGVDKYQSVMTTSRDRCLSAEEKRAEKILYDRRQPVSEWGKVARKQEKAARKLAKASEREIQG